MDYNLCQGFLCLKLCFNQKNKSHDFCQYFLQQVGLPIQNICLDGKIRGLDNI